MPTSPGAGRVEERQEFGDIVNDAYNEMTLEELVEALLQANGEWDRRAAAAEADVGGAAKIHRIAEMIIILLLRKPGCLIYISDPNKRKEAEDVIGRIWREGVEEDTQLFDKIFYGAVTEDEMTGVEVHHEGVALDFSCEFRERVPLLKPTLISVKASEEVTRYFEESMAAWLRGLDEAAVILAWSVLEVLLRNGLLKKDISLVFDVGSGKDLKRIKREKDAAELIDNAVKCGILPKLEAGYAHYVRKLRNDAVHSLNRIDRVESLKALTLTKQLVEALLNKA